MTSTTMPHGYVWRYAAGCRCGPCRAAKAAYQAALRASRHGLPDGDPRHGTVSGYRNHMCRCDGCRTVMRPRWKAWDANRIARREPS